MPQIKYMVLAMLLSFTATVLVAKQFKKTIRYMDDTVCESDSLNSVYYGDGNVWMETPYLNGRIHGKKKLYYQNGNILRVVEYSNDREDGMLIDYTPNGEIRAQVQIVNGEYKN